MNAEPTPRHQYGADSFRTNSIQSYSEKGLPMGMMWFGDDWGGEICQEAFHDATPVGEICLWCEEEIEEGDRGVIQAVLKMTNEFETRPQHLNCFLRSVLGSVGHLRKQCSCYGGTEEDPPGLTMRQAADAAADERDRINHGSN